MSCGDPPTYFPCAGCACAMCQPSPFHPLQAITDAPSLVPSLPPRRLIVGFTGPAGSGKSEAAKRLIAEHGFTQGKFANGLKVMLRALLRYRGADDVTIGRMIEGDLKELPTPLLNGRSPRHAMQTLGTEWGRDCIDGNLWVDTEMEVQTAVANLVFDDVRYPNEADAVTAAGGVLIHVARSGAGIGDNHSSEACQIATVDTLHNDGSFELFHSRIDVLVRDLSWALAKN